MLSTFTKLVKMRIITCLIIFAALIAVVIALVYFMKNPINNRNRDLPLEGSAEITNVSPINPEYNDAIRGELFDETQLERILNKEVSLSKPPKLYLADPLSSVMNSFEVPQLGGYSWSLQEDGDKWNSIIACGSGPFELAKDCRRLTVTKYNKMNKTPYTVYFEIDPTSIVICEYNVPTSWEADPVMISQTTYSKDEIFILEIERGKIYHIKAEWTKEMFESYGFYGEAEYVLVTQ